MLCEILQPIQTRCGVLQKGTLADIPQEVFRKLSGKVRSISNEPEIKTVQYPKDGQLIASSFDTEHWRQQIKTAINTAINMDKGALEHCSHYRPDLHSACIAASRALDDAYSTKDARQIRQAIREHNKACKATRYAAQHPMKAHKLSPAEITRFCNTHMAMQGGQCSYKGKLDGCTIWEAKNKNLTIDQLEIPPERYLDLHQ